MGFLGPEALCAELLTDHSHLAFTRSRKNVDHDNIELSNNSRSFELNRHFPTPAILPCFLASLSKNFLNQWRKSKLSWNFSFTNRSTSTLWIIILRKPRIFSITLPMSSFRKVEQTILKFSRQSDSCLGSKCTLERGTCPAQVDRLQIISFHKIKY